MAFNASKLFYTTTESESAFLDNITLLSGKKEKLLSARMELRTALREAAGKAVEKVVQGPSARVRPRFVTQGSVSYRTLNSPCAPPQQADLDDGMYFPLSYVQQGGTPSVAADILFNAVSACLKEVAKVRGWTVDESNPRCTRVIVASDMHIDVPMYSIPDAEFGRLVEARVQKIASASGHRVELTEAQEDDDWSFVESDRVLLATRDSGWLPKDPRPIKVWVETAIEKKGEQLRRVMRYLKAWRDYQKWEYGDPKSLLIMVAAEAAHIESIHGRDDLAVKAAARGMARILEGSLFAPWDRSEDLAARLDEHPKLRKDVISRLIALANGIEDALDRSLHAAGLCDALRGLFGQRMPNNVAAVLMATVEGTDVSKSPSAGFVGRVQSA